MSRRRTDSCLRTVLIVILLGLCLIVCGSLTAYEVLPARAQEVFGPADPEIDPVQKITLSARLLFQQDTLTLPADPTGSPKTFRVVSGDSVKLIALQLEETGLIRDAGAFQLYLVYSGGDRQLQAGDFTLDPKNNALQIAAMLQDAKAKDVIIRVLAGWRKEELAAAVAASGLAIKADDFVKTASMPNSLVSQQLSLALTDYEGFFFPETYRFSRSATVNDVISTFVAKFDQSVGSDLRLAYQKQGLNLYEAVILASIVQRESVALDEQPMIASVFLNRLRKGMKLDSDPTVQYAIGYNPVQKTWWTNPLSLKDLKTDSPYNTYMRVGLPPGPIASPGLSALKAVAYPAQTPYYYFQAKCDKSGYHNFAVTYDEHLKNSCP